MRKQGLLVVLFVCIDLSVIFAQWQYAGLAGKDIYSLKIKDDKIYAETSGEVYFTNDNRTHWYLFNTKATKITFSNDNIIIFDDSYISFSSNEGASWVRIEGEYYSRPSYIKVFYTVGNSIFASGEYGFFISTNNGVDWSKQSSTGGANDIMFCNNILFITSSIYHEKSIYGNNSYWTGSVLISNDLGMTWSSVMELYNVKCLTLANRSSNILVGTSSGIYLTTNFGGSWEQNQELKDIEINTIVNDSNNLYAGTNKGVFLSSNSGVNWSSFNVDLPEGVKIKTLLISNDYLYAGFFKTGLASGVWKCKL